MLHARAAGLEKRVAAVVGMKGLADRDRRRRAGHGLAFGREHAALLQSAREIIGEGRHRADDGGAADVVAEAERRGNLGARLRQHPGDHRRVEQRDRAGAQIDRRQHHVGLAAGRRHHEIKFIGGACAADPQRRLLGGDPDPDGGRDRDQEDEQEIGAAVAGDRGADDEDRVHDPPT